MQADDHQIVTLTEEERAEWTTALEPMIDEYLAGLEEKGIDDAREIYDALKTYAETH